MSAVLLFLPSLPINTYSALRQGFSTLLTFWAAYFSVGSCPGHCRIFSTIPGLYP